MQLKSAAKLSFVVLTTWNITTQKGKIYNIKIKGIALIINFGGNKTVRNRSIDVNSEKGASVSEVLALFMAVQVDEFG